MIVRKSYVSCFLSLLKGSHGSGVRTSSNIAYRSGQTWTVDAITAWQRHVLCSLPWLSSINNSTILTSFQVISDKDNLRIYVRLSISVDIKAKSNAILPSRLLVKVRSRLLPRDTTWPHVTCHRPVSRGIVNTNCGGGQKIDKFWKCATIKAQKPHYVSKTVPTQWFLSEYI